MKDKTQKRRLIDWRRRYLTLDKYMSGSFVTLFGWTIIISFLIFLGIYGVILFIGWWNNDAFLLDEWTPGEAFIQLTNPARHPYISSWEWVGIVLINLFGLVVLNGIILTLLVNWVSNRKDRHEKGEARYDYIFTRKFSVILGGHPIVADITKDLMHKNENEYVVIQTKRNPELLRKEIFAAITDANVAKRVIIYSGDRTSLHELRELQLDKAQQIFLIGESKEIDGTSHDALNMQTWKLMHELYSEKRSDRIPTHVMFEYQSTFSAFQFTDLVPDMAVPQKENVLQEAPENSSFLFRFIPFSVYENWSQQVLICKSETTDSKPYYIPLDGDGISYDSPERVHLIIVGMSKMGVALGIEGAHIAHYPNFNNKTLGNPRTLITFIDVNAKREMLYFMGRFKDLFKLARWRYIKAPEDVMAKNTSDWDIYDSQSKMDQRDRDDSYKWIDPLAQEELQSPYYGYLGENLIDVDFEFIEGDISLPSIQKYISDACADNKKNMTLSKEKECASKTTIAICLPESSAAMSAALYFNSSVYENVQQIWVQQSVSGALVDAVSKGTTGKNSAKFEKLRPFGMLDKCDYFIRINNILPKLINEAYKYIYSKQTLYNFYKDTDYKIIAKNALQSWSMIQSKNGKSSIAKKWSNIYCANSFESKLRSVPEDKKSQYEITDPVILKQLSMTEHNRWVMEQLLLGYRPVDKEYIPEGGIGSIDGEMKEILKDRKMHPDIVANEILGDVQENDEYIVKIIPFAIEIEKNIQ